MRRLPAVLALAAALLVPAVAVSQQPTVEPDRPDQTSRPTTVPRGSVQLEGGVEYERTGLAGPDEHAFHVQATLRFGLTDRLELRFEGEPFVRLRGAEDASGLGDLTLSIRSRLVDAGEDSAWPALAVQPFVKLPTADDPLGSERADFGLIFIAGFDLPGGFEAGLNAGVAAIGQRDPDGYLVQGLAAAGSGRALIADSLGAYVDMLLESRDERVGRGRVSVGTGLGWKVGRRLVLDLGFETTVAGRGADCVIRSGLSVLLNR